MSTSPHVPTIPLLQKGAWHVVSQGFVVTVRDGFSSWWRPGIQYMNKCQREVREEDEPPCAAPSWAEPSALSFSLFFSTAGVLKGARCGSERKGGEGPGGGVAEMLGWVEGDGQKAPTCPKGSPTTGVTPRSLPHYFRLPADGEIRGQGQAFPGEPWAAGKGEGYGDSCHSNITLET